MSFVYIRVYIYFVLANVVALVGGGSVINAPTQSSSIQYPGWKVRQDKSTENLVNLFVSHNLIGNLLRKDCLFL